MKRIFLVVSALALAGCGSIPVVKPAASALDAYHGQKLTVVTYEIPSFVANTAGGAAFGVIGALASISAGEHLVAENHIADPADAMATKLSGDLAQELKPSDVQVVTGVKRSADSPDAVAKLATSGGVVLDVQTLGWMFIYFPLNWGHYTVVYSARARLIDAPTGKLIAQVPCTYNSDSEKTAATYDELTASQAALLKQKLATGGSACTAVVEQNMLGYPAPPAPASGSAAASLAPPSGSSPPPPVQAATQPAQH